MKKELTEEIRHVDITSFDSTPIINAMRDMSFSSRDTARAADILSMMVSEDKCMNVLVLAGSTSAGGCMKVYADMIRYNMIDVVVSTGGGHRRHGLLRGTRFQALQGRPDGG